MSSIHEKNANKILCHFKRIFYFYIRDLSQISKDSHCRCYLWILKYEFSLIGIQQKIAQTVCYNYLNQIWPYFGQRNLIIESSSNKLAKFSQNYKKIF